MEEIEDFDNIDKENLYSKNQLTRNNEIYKNIENFEQFEFTHCLAFEFAMRNKKVCELLTFLEEFFLYYNKTIYPKKDFDNCEFNKIKILCQKFLFDFKKIDTYREIMHLELKNVKSMCNIVVETLIEELYEKYYVIYKNELEFSDDIYNKNKFIERDKELTKFSQKEMSDDTCYNIKHTDSYNIVQISNKSIDDFSFCTIYPNFKTAMRDFSTTKITLNLSLPEKDLLSFISLIKKDHDVENSSIKNIYELLGKEFHIGSEELKNLTNKEWADYFFIYDYIEKTEDKNRTTAYQKLQEIFTSIYGYKIEKIPEEIINDRKKRDNSKFKIISSEKYNKLDTETKKTAKQNISVDTLKDRYKFMENLIKNCKYKFLINKYIENEEN